MTTHQDKAYQEALRREILERSIPEPNSGCWLWVGTAASKGYGALYFQGTAYRAHRASYLAFRGDIGNLLVCHRCDVRGCVNPNHLFLGTHRENNLDRDRKGRQNILKGEHAYKTKLTTEQVLFIRSSGLPHKMMAEMLGVHGSNIRAILDRRSWKHLPPSDSDKRARRPIGRQSKTRGVAT